MRSWSKALIVLVATFVLSTGVFSPGVQAQTPPDLSGVWVGLGGLPRTAETAICGIQGVCGALTGIKPEPNPNTAEEPEMLP